MAAPPRSVNSSDVVLFAFRPPGTSLFHQIDGADTKSAVGEGICRITFYPNGTFMFVHLDEHCTRIGAVMRADGGDNSGVTSWHISA